MMPWPGSLSEEEQEIVTVFVDQGLRRSLVHFVRTLNLLNGMKEEWDNRVQALFNKITNNDVIPKDIGNNMPASEAMTKSEIVALLTEVNNVLTTYNTALKRVEYVKAVGSVNMIRVE